MINEADNSENALDNRICIKVTTNNDISKEEDDFIKGASQMLSYLLRASRPYGFRFVCGLSKESKYEFAFELLKNFFEFEGMVEVDISGLAMEMSRLSLEAKNPVLYR